MFYLLSIISMVGYGIQVSLLAHISRKMDALDIGFYRNASFLITLSPLLFFSSFEEISLIKDHFPKLAIMGFSAVLAMWGTFASFRFLPVGISQSVKKVMTALFIFLMGFIYLKETLSIPEVLLITLGISAAVYLGRQKNHMEHLDKRAVIGFILVFVTSLPSGITYFMAANLAREVSPFVAGYFWEASIAMASGITLLLRYILTRKKPEWIGFRGAGKIALAASPTLLGTGAFATAVTLGPIAIVSSIGLGAVAVSTLVAHFAYHEKLSKKQWVSIFVTLIAIGGLKFV